MNFWLSARKRWIAGALTSSTLYKRINQPNGPKAGPLQRTSGRDAAIYVVRFTPNNCRDDRSSSCPLWANRDTSHCEKHSHSSYPVGLMHVRAGPPRDLLRR
jgi:hypothetical protein